MRSLLVRFAVPLLAALLSSAVGRRCRRSAAPGWSEGGEVRGLIIGIDAYQHYRATKRRRCRCARHRDCVALGRHQDVVSLIDAAADRDSVIREIGQLVTRTQPNDLVILTIAGHGAQEPERVKGSEPDGMDNVFLLPGFDPTPTGSQQRVLGRSSTTSSSNSRPKVPAWCLSRTPAMAAVWCAKSTRARRK